MDPKYEVWRIDQDTGAETLVAIFMLEEDAAEYGTEYIEGDFTDFRVKKRDR